MKHIVLTVVLVLALLVVGLTTATETPMGMPDVALEQTQPVISEDIGSLEVATNPGKIAAVSYTEYSFDDPCISTKSRRADRTIRLTRNLRGVADRYAGVV